MPSSFLRRLALFLVLVPPGHSATGLTPATATLTPSGSNQLGTALTLTANVSPSAASGKVTFYDGTTVLGTRTLSGGTASMSQMVFLTAGGHSLRVHYQGDSSFAPASSPSVSFTVVARAGAGAHRTQDLSIANDPTFGGATSVAIPGNFKNAAVPQMAFQAFYGIQTWSGSANGFNPDNIGLSNGCCSAIALADVNGDGFMDMITQPAGGAGLAFWPNNGAGAFPTFTIIDSGFSVTTGRLAAVDFDGDGKVDLIFATASGIQFQRGNGDGTFQLPTVVDADPSWGTLVAGDFDHDGNADIAVLHSSTFVIFYGNGNGTFQAGPTNTFPFGASLPSGTINAADLNGDGLPDLAFSDFTWGTIVAINSGARNPFQTPAFIATATTQFSSAGLAVADWNGDGALDLVIPIQNAPLQNHVLVYLNMGNGSFNTASPLDLGAFDDPSLTSAVSVAVGDFNQDGLTDVVVGHTAFVHDGVVANFAVLLGTNTSSTTTTASSITRPFVFAADTVPMTATVTSSAGVVNTGTVTFTVQGLTGSASGSVVNGQASASFAIPAFLAPQTLTITASYSDSSNTFAPSSNSASTLTVTSASSTIQPNNATAAFSTSSQQVSLSASVTSPAGTVSGFGAAVFFTLFNGSTPVTGQASGPVVNGVGTASLTLPANLPIGVYSIHATFDGDEPELSPSFDTTKTLTLGPSPTTVTAANLTTGYSAASQNVTLTAALTNQAGTVSGGSVTFSVAGIAGTVAGAVSGGSASAPFTIPAGQTPGVYAIAASYPGTTTFGAGSDSSHNLTISKAPTTTTAGSASAVFSPSSQSLSLSATVTSGLGPVNGGTVTFGINGIAGSIVQATVSNGSASASVTLPGGASAISYSIQANYGGGAILAASSGTNTLTIAKATPAISWANPADMLYGQVFTAAQLNPSSSAPGSFTYVLPGSSQVAGVLPLAGPHQLLTANFTPSDAVDYLPGRATAFVNVNQEQLVVSVTGVSRDPSTHEVLVSLAYSDVAGLPYGDTMSDVIVTHVALGPQSLAAPFSVINSPLGIAPGASLAATLRFPASVGATGARVALQLNGSYNQFSPSARPNGSGSFSVASRVVLP